MDLATCFSELTRFFVRQNDICIELRPLVTFGASRLSEGSLHIGRARWKVNIHSTVLLLFFNCCYCSYRPSPLEEIHSFGVRNVPSGTGMRHHEASQLLYLQFSPLSRIVRAVLAFHRRVSMNSNVTNQLQATVPVTLFAVPCLNLLSLLCPLCLCGLRLVRLHPRLQWHFVMESGTVGLSGAVHSHFGK